MPHVLLAYWLEGGMGVLGNVLLRNIRILSKKAKCRFWKQKGNVDFGSTGKTVGGISRL